MIAKLALEDGCVLTGEAVGARGTRSGEVVFNTAMTGYQEIFTDPSYCGQIVTMTFPLQGNYGINPEDFESEKPSLSGVVLRELPPRPSNFRSTSSLAEFLEAYEVVGLSGVDTRALTRRIRTQGAMRGILSTEITDDLELVARARQVAPMEGANLIAEVARRETGSWTEPLSPRLGDVQPGSGSSAVGRTSETASADVAQGRGGPHVVVIDCGIKRNILRFLVSAGCRVTVVPGLASSGTIRDLQPDGLVVGNGPGDPSAVVSTVETLQSLIGTLPIFGICLGHQLLALALGARTYKLRFGHHGANLPVLRTTTGRVEITSQNHGFAVDAPSLERVGGTPTHINLNDGSLEGFLHQDRQVFAVQYHPEASPGPHDATHLLEHLALVLRNRRPIDLELIS